jgi:hypothetical protein
VRTGVRKENDHAGKNHSIESPQGSQEKTIALNTGRSVRQEGDASAQTRTPGQIKKAGRRDRPVESQASRGSHSSSKRTGRFPEIA